MNGLLAKKIGMTQVYDAEGAVIPVTVLEAGPCVVAQIKTENKDGYNAVQLGFGQRKKAGKLLKKQLKDLPFMPQHLKEFKVEKTDGINRGQEIKVDIFSAGEYVVVSGNSIGKGFTGTIRRWNFSRGDMGHGSKSHRIPGSIGGGTTPGRVLKGKKMAGRMGNEKITQKNIMVVAIDLEQNLILVKGSVPGPSNSILSIIKQGEANKDFKGVPSLAVKKEEVKKEEPKAKEKKEGTARELSVQESKDNG